MPHDALVILGAGALLAVGVAAAALAARLRLPALILFLGLGMAVGSDGLGWIVFDDYRLTRLIGTIALVLILFEGGAATGWRRIRPVLRPALLLAVVGTVGTAAITGLAATGVFGFSLPEGLLLGAILAATDGAAVFTLLRGIRLPQRLSRTLEAEAGFNDAIAVLLVLIVIEFILAPHYGPAEAIAFVAREVGLGALVGALVGATGSLWLRRNRGLASALVLVGSLAAAAVAYGAAGALGGSGFVAVYMTGLSLGDAAVPERSALLAFHQGLASVAEIGMFFVLGLLVFPGQFGGIAVKAVSLALITAIVARPLSAYLATWRQGFERRERVLLGWAGLRGAVPVILATLPVIRGVPGSVEFLNIVFFAVLVSAALQGATVELLASRLGLVARAPRRQHDDRHGRDPSAALLASRAWARELSDA